MKYIALALLSLVTTGCVNYRTDNVPINLERYETDEVVCFVPRATWNAMWCYKKENK